MYDFHRTDRDAARLTAERVANDVRSIMLNRGGPVASRTVYPILERTFEQAGLQVAIEPSPVTTASIRKLFSFEPRGIPPDWPLETHHEGRVELRADEPCLQCHVDAGVADVLGTVTVRDYLSGRLEGWWKDVRLTGTLNLVKIVIHSVIVFFARPRGRPPLSKAPGPWRFAQGMAATFMLAAGLSLLRGWTAAAYAFEGFIAVAFAALLLGKFCLGAYVYHLLRGNVAFANGTCPWSD